MPGCGFGRFLIPYHCTVERLFLHKGIISKRQQYRVITVSCHFFCAPDFEAIKTRRATIHAGLRVIIFGHKKAESTGLEPVRNGMVYRNYTSVKRLRVSNLSEILVYYRGCCGYYFYHFLPDFGDFLVTIPSLLSTTYANWIAGCCGISTSID